MVQYSFWVVKKKKERKKISLLHTSYVMHIMFGNWSAEFRRKSMNEF